MTLEHVTQRSCGCSDPRAAQGWAGWSYGQPDLVEGFPAHSMGLELSDPYGFFQQKNVLWSCDWFTSFMKQQPCLTYTSCFLLEFYFLGFKKYQYPQPFLASCCARSLCLPCTACSSSKDWVCGTPHSTFQFFSFKFLGTWLEYVFLQPLVSYSKATYTW